MNRRPVLSPSGLSRRAALGRIAAVGAALGLTTRPSRAAAQDAMCEMCEMAKHPIVGSWRVSLAVTGAMDQEGALNTFSADGTVLASVKPVSPAPPGASFGRSSPV